MKSLCDHLGSIFGCEFKGGLTKKEAQILMAALKDLNRLLGEILTKKEK